MRSGILLCRVVWAETYRFKKEAFFAGNMRYPAAHGIAHELLNFALEEDGLVHGFAENRGQNINIQKLGARARSDSVGDVLVLFCAVDQPSMKLRLVGWYENATVYRQPQKAEKGSSRGNWSYYFSTTERDAHLLPATARDLEVPRKRRITDRGFIGQRSFFYPAGNPNYERFLESVGFLRQPLPASDPNVDADEFQEGQRRWREASYLARNPRLVQLAKDHYGTACLACGFDFGETYGPLGQGFAEVHHKQPMSDGETRLSTVRDVDVLCANCHRMVHHRKGEILTLAGLKRIIEENAG